MTRCTSRFYCPNLAEALSSAKLSDAPVALDRDEAHHARRVLRLADGEGIELFDGCGCVAEATLVAAGRTVGARIASVRRVEPLRPMVDVAVALPKGPRADQLVQQLTQLGADRVIPLRTRHSVIDPRGSKLDRLRQIVVEATKQCGRAYLMEVAEVTDFGDVDFAAYDLRLLADAEGGTVIDAAAVRSARRVLILVGPEGGWSDDELAAADEAGCVRWSLGPNVLRIETAAAAAVVVVRYHRQAAIAQ